MRLVRSGSETVRSGNETVRTGNETVRSGNETVLWDETSEVLRWNELAADL